MRNMSRGISDAAYSTRALVFSAFVFSRVLVLSPPHISHFVFVLFAFRSLGPGLHAVLLGSVSSFSPFPRAYERPTCPAPVQQPARHLPLPLTAQRNARNNILELFMFYFSIFQTPRWLACAPLCSPLPVASPNIRPPPNAISALASSLVLLDLLI